MKHTTEELWQAVQTLDHAVEYIQTDAGKRDITWNHDLDDACKLIQHKADKLRSRAYKQGVQA